jgi:hypothetical protein
MQNRYVGDVGDFGKYSLLQAIEATTLRLGIIWCLFPDENHNLDGLHTGYLHRSEFRDLNPALHERLAQIVRAGKRSIKQVCAAKIFAPTTVSFDMSIALKAATRSDRENHRQKWISRALIATSSCEVVFFDPDNGLEVASVRRNSPRAGKYIFFDELTLFWQRGQSIILYHHMNRTTSIKNQTIILKRRLSSVFPKAAILRPLLFRRGSCRQFWIFGQRTHRVHLHAGIETLFKSGWRAHFEFP